MASSSFSCTSPAMTRGPSSAKAEPNATRSGQPSRMLVFENVLAGYVLLRIISMLPPLFVTLTQWHARITGKLSVFVSRLASGVTGTVIGLLSLVWSRLISFFVPSCLFTSPFLFAGALLGYPLDLLKTRLRKLLVLVEKVQSCHLFWLIKHYSSGF